MARRGSTAPIKTGWAAHTWIWETPNLQQPHFDVCPEPGMLIIFPSCLNHKAMPYEGVTDRIVVSFNAQIHGAQGENIFNYAAG